MRGAIIKTSEHTPSAQRQLNQGWAIPLTLYWWIKLIRYKNSILMKLSGEQNSHFHILWHMDVYKGGIFWYYLSSKKSILNSIIYICYTVIDIVYFCLTYLSSNKQLIISIPRTIEMYHITFKLSSEWFLQDINTSQDKLD